jgi:hypothetical protein
MASDHGGRCDPIPPATPHIETVALFRSQRRLNNLQSVRHRESSVTRQTVALQRRRDSRPFAATFDQFKA